MWLWLKQFERPFFCVYNCIHSAFCCSEAAWPFKKTRIFCHVGTSTLYFFHLQLHEVRFHKIFGFGDPFIVHKIWNCLWYLHLIKLLPRFHWGWDFIRILLLGPVPVSVSGRLGPYKTTSPSGKLIIHLFRSCLDSCTDSWAALSF